MADMIVIVILLILIGTAILFIRKEKKRGGACIGCPAGGTCPRRNTGCGCEGSEKEHKTY